ncbi:uncharacterized protein BJX67DRAFT_224492 [Aspergillus lucknowensis]|uniref:Ig-like domain-containing protein n=1 Tax=Aspergillus lucknowensis TaxID=176173 RepID=A0ABR4LJX1_9EURO
MPSTMVWVKCRPRGPNSRARLRQRATASSLLENEPSHGTKSSCHPDCGSHGRQSLILIIVVEQASSSATTGCRTSNVSMDSAKPNLIRVRSNQRVADSLECLSRPDFKKQTRPDLVWFENGATTGRIDWSGESDIVCDRRDEKLQCVADVQSTAVDL